MEEKKSDKQSFLKYCIYDLYDGFKIFVAIVAMSLVIVGLILLISKSTPKIDCEKPNTNIEEESIFTEELIIDKKTGVEYIRRVYITD